MASMIADLSCRTCTYVLTGGEEIKHTVYADIYYQFDSNCMRSLGLDAPSGNKSTIQYLTDNSTFGGYSGDRAAEFLRTVCPIQQSGETNKVVLLCQLAFAGILFSVASVLFSEGAHKFKEFAGWITKPFSKNKVVVSAVKPFIGGTLFIGIYFLIKYLSGWDFSIVSHTGWCRSSAIRVCRAWRLRVWYTLWGCPHHRLLITTAAAAAAAKRPGTPGPKPSDNRVWVSWAVPTMMSPSP
jgi:hypothetical protein